MRTTRGDWRRRLRRQGLRIGLALIATLTMLIHIAGFYPIAFLDQLEAHAYDARVRLFAQATPDPRVVIVDIDEKSLEAEGRWPWGRDRVAGLIDRLFDEYGAAVVGFDVVFAESDASSGLPVLQALAAGRLRGNAEFRAALTELTPALDRDARLVAALRDRPVVLGVYFTHRGEAGAARSAGALPEPAFNFIEFVEREIPFIRADGFGANRPEFQAAARGGGHFNPLYDIDGVSRRVPMLMEYEADYYPALALAVARLYLGEPPLEPVFAQGYDLIEALRLGERRIPVDANVAALVPFRGKAGSFPYLSATDVLRGQVDPAALRDRIVLIGTSAPGLMDLRVTPVANAYPGVEIHANLVAGILDGTIKQRPGYVLGLELVAAAVLGVLLALLLPSLGAVRASALTLGLVALLVAANLYAWQAANLVLPIANLVLLCLLLWIIDILYGFFVEARAKRQVTEMFGQYVPPEVVDELTERPEAVSMEGENRDMTVLFSDVRDFTSISETLSAPQLTRLMNAYLTRMTEVMQQHQGTVDKYIGDAIMAFWGAPLPDPDHPRHALACALAMQDAATGLRTEFRARGWPELRIGIGLNRGPMNVGNMGSAFRRAYTVMGDAVNLGSRLESLSKRYGVGIVVSESVVAACPEIQFRPLDRIRVKGKQEAVRIYQPLSPAEAVAAADILPRWNEALTAYAAQDWATLEARLNELQAAADNPKLIDIYRERMVVYRQSPPPEDWDGVYAYETK